MAIRTARTTTFSYGPDGELSATVYPNGTSQEDSYDPTGFIDSISYGGPSGQLGSFSYERNPDGLVASVLAEGPGLAPQPYQHSYSYLPTGYLGSADGQPFSYDPAGGITSMGETTFSYAQAGELSSSTTSSTAGTFQASYGFDPEGNRTSVSSPTSTTTFSYDASGSMTGLSSPQGDFAFSYDSSGLRATEQSKAGVYEFSWDTTTSVPRLVSDSVNDYVYGPGATPIEEISQSTGLATYLYVDQLGSVVMESDSSGEVTATRSYDPYGKVASTTGTWNGPFGFAGGYRDPTGLIYLINRYYDPATGQFMSVDPLVASTQQPYEYGGDDPVNEVDPDGLAAYSYTFNLGNLGFAGAIANFVHANCATVFPLANCSDNFTVGQVMHLQMQWGPFTQTFPVRVVSVGSTSFTFKALNGHLEGRGRTITFSFRQSTFCGVTLNVSTSSNGSILTNWPVIRDMDFWAAHRVWEQFASNIKTDYHS